MATRKKETAGTSNSSHTQIAYEGIKRFLITNELTPGQKISYRKLADRLGMSLTPVIQALKQLEFQGLVKYEANKGYSTEPMSMQEIQEIYEMRELIEISLLPYVMDNIDETGIKKLQSLLSKQDLSIRESYPNERLMKDQEFHLVLASLSKRKVQIQILQHLFNLLYLKYGASLLFKQPREPVGSQHRHIFDAVVSHNMNAAEKALRDHFHKIKSQALMTLGKMITEKTDF
jgi:DNA-binding GntR family transcriptional regulator